VNPPKERYVTGPPCKRGHPGRRYRSTGHCVDCMAIHARAQRQRIKERRSDATAP
jgi:hypothetical protein